MHFKILMQLVHFITNVYLFIIHFITNVAYILFSFFYFRRFYSYSNLTRVNIYYTMIYYINKSISTPYIVSNHSHQHKINNSSLPTEQLITLLLTR